MGAKELMFKDKRLGFNKKRLRFFLSKWEEYLQ